MKRADPKNIPYSQYWTVTTWHGDKREGDMRYELQMSSSMSSISSDMSSWASREAFKQKHTAVFNLDDDTETGISPSKPMESMYRRFSAMDMWRVVLVTVSQAKPSEQERIAIERAEMVTASGLPEPDALHVVFRDTYGVEINRVILGEGAEAYFSDSKSMFESSRLARLKYENPTGLGIWKTEDISDWPYCGGEIGNPQFLAWLGRNGLPNSAEHRGRTISCPGCGKSWCCDGQSLGAADFK